MEQESFKKIQFKLVVVFIAALVSILCLILVLNSRQNKFIRQNSNLSSLINSAGRQRMLSQNITKNTLLAVTDFDERDHQQLLDSLRGQFEGTHIRLKAENELLKEHDKAYQVLDSLFARIERYHLGILESSRGVMMAQDDSLRYRLIRELLIQESQFLPLMDHITGAYEQLGDKILMEINTKDSLVNIIITLAILATIVTLFFFTVTTLRSYASDLEDTRQKLITSVKDAQFRIEKLEFLTGAIKVGIWEKSIEEQTEYWSGELYHMLGYEPGAFPGTAENFVNKVHEEDVQKLLDTTDVSVRTGLASTVELRIRTREGEYKWVEVTGNAKRNAHGKIMLMVGGVVDINDRKKLETQLKVFIENAPAPIAMFNKNMEYISASQRWMEQYHVTDRVIIGLSHYDVFPDLPAEWRAVFDRCLSTGQVEQRDQDLFYTNDGAFEWVKWEVRPWYQNIGEIGGLLMFTEDITREKERSEELRKAKEEAEQASKAKEQFLATMSHEIRTPLNAINSLTQILLSESPRQDQLPHLSLLRFSGDNLLTLVNDILDISKIEAGKLTLEKTTFDLYYVIDSIRKSLTYRAQENMVEVKTRYDEQLPHYFEGDVTRITQIIYNLAGNAIKFTKEGTVTIEVKALAHANRQHTFRVSVQDTGIGISPEHQEKIFESFEQGDTGTTRQYGGTGLGLYITKTLLTMMNSQIRLKSALGKGSEFYFDITLDEGSENLRHSSTSYLKEPDFSRRNIYVLVAEDSPANQYIMRKFLSKIGVKFDIVEDGEKAVEKVRQGLYDLILMDLQMPVMDGYTATIKIRANKVEYFQQLPIIALTADAFMDIRKKTLSIGMTDYLSKPFKPADLYAMLDKYAGKVKKRMQPESGLEEVVSRYGDGDTAFTQDFVTECVREYESYMRVLKSFEADQNIEVLKQKSHNVQTINQLLGQPELSQAVEELLEVNGDPNPGMRIDQVIQQCFRVIGKLNMVKAN